MPPTHVLGGDPGVWGNLVPPAGWGAPGVSLGRWGAGVAPVLWYGTSIMNGAAASRPANASVNA